MAVAVNALYTAMVPIANDDAALRNWLRANGPKPLLDIDRVWLGEAPKTAVPLVGGVPVGLPVPVPLSLVIFGEPNETKANQFATAGNVGRLRIYCNVPRELRHAGVAVVGEHLDRLFDDKTLGVIGHAIVFSEIDIVNSFPDPDGVSYRGVFEFAYQTVTT